ncbi:MAG TPA: hypothetical protein VF771_16500 [Longimicrobiaceae bacterium]
MRAKLKLNLDHLAVDSFTTQAVMRPSGTVRAQQCTCYTACTCPGCPTCDASCNGTCDVSCNGTCDATCDCSYDTCDYCTINDATCHNYGTCVPGQSCPAVP